MSPAHLINLAPKIFATKTIPMRAVRKMLMQYVNPELRSVLMFPEFWDDPLRRELFSGGRSELLPNWRREWLEGAYAHADNPVERMLWMDNHTYLPGDLLVKMDIASMHCGLETRSPLLDHEVIEFCAGLPVQYKVKDGVGKYLLKKLAERYFPVEFVHRRKMGFAVPLASWLRGPLLNIMKEILKDVQLMTPLSIQVIERILREFEIGSNEHASRIWALLMYGAWRQQQAGGF